MEDRSSNEYWTEVERRMTEAQRRRKKFQNWGQKFKGVVTVAQKWDNVSSKKED